MEIEVAKEIVVQIGTVVGAIVSGWFAVKVVAAKVTSKSDTPEHGKTFLIDVLTSMAQEQSKQEEMVEKLNREVDGLKLALINKERDILAALRWGEDVLRTAKTKIPAGEWGVFPRPPRHLEDQLDQEVMDTWKQG